MFMKIAKMRENREDNKGFSLVELIIVMAIMVALIAVLAPQFVKYVQRARDSSVSDAAENVYEMVKSEYALGNIVLSGSSGTIVVSACNGDGKIVINPTGIAAGSAAPSGYSFYAACGIADGKAVSSDVVYTITISGGKTSPVFNMTKEGAVVTTSTGDIAKS